MINVNLTYIRIDLVRCFRDVTNLLFTFAMPVFMYLLFGRAQYSDVQSGRGTVGFHVMSSMGAYGAVIAATAVAATAATESMLGWGRQLALTKQRPLGFVANKVAVAIVLGALSSGLVFIVGALTGTRADAWWVWVASWAIGILGAGLFGVYGLAMGLLLKSESAAGVASGTVVFLAFLGNMFMPLTGVMLDIARFTPMYGYVGLVRYPQVEGEIQQTDPVQTDSIWLLLANCLAWLLVFSGLALLGQGRSRKRQ